MSSNETSSNPFDEEYEDPKNIESNCASSEISYHDIATKLLSDNLLLTALELHAELIEAGKELPKLRVFFSNPGNFEHHTSSKPELLPSTIARSLSQATLDSLDLTRYSEDGERGVDERVAVLEFELRKAKETISALRANLTVATESETPTPDGSSTKIFGIEPAKPHEKRALNFLVNEYLLSHGYKLTSITFSDENENQDFEDWDDVGLNISKPAELLLLYRDYMRQASHVRPPGQDFSTQTDFSSAFDRVSVPESEVPLSYQSRDEKNAVALDALLLPYQEEMSTLLAEKQELHEKLCACERSLAKREIDAEVPQPLRKLSSAPRSEDQFNRDDEDGDGWTAVTPIYIGDRQRLVSEDDQISADIDWASVTMSSPDPVKIPWSGSQSGSGSGSASGGPDNMKGHTGEDDDQASGDTDWTPVAEGGQIETRCSNSAINSEALINVFERPLSSTFRQEVLVRCMVDTAQLPDKQQHILDSLSKASTLSSLPTDIDKLAHVLATVMMSIIPYVILNKREEVIPLLVATVKLHSDRKERDVLLHQLFNLKKRPNDEERRLILAGLVCIAQSMEAEVVENDVLAQCWEQINHKCIERRLLVAEACGVLAPFVTRAIRNSLILSMLQQMLSEDREETVRMAVVRSAALIAALSPDCEKYAQCEDLVISCMGDSALVVNVVLKTLLPVVAQWALSSCCLQTTFLPRLIAQLRIQLKGKTVASPSNSLSGGTNVQRALNVMATLTAVLPHLVLCVANVDRVVANISSDLPAPHTRVGFSELCRGLSSPAVFHSGSASVGQLIAAFDLVLRDTDRDNEWHELQWMSKKMLPELMEALSSISISQEDLLSSFIAYFRFLCAGFGPYIVSQQIKPIFVEKLQEIEQELLESAGSYQKPWPSLSILTVYLAGVLSTGQSELEIEDLRSTLRRFLMALPLCSTTFNSKSGPSPLDALWAAVSALCDTKRDIILEAVLNTLWEGVVSPKPPVRCATASLFAAAIGSIPESLVSTRIAPALVTLGSDPDISVRTATVPAFGRLITSTTIREVKEKVCLQLQSVLADPATRDSHPLLLQLITTLGQVVSACDASFREDVVLPQLAGLAAYASQLQNLTRRLDLAVALIEAFSSAVYISLPMSVLSSAVLPGLRYLEQIGQFLQPVHQETIIAMIREVESRSDAQLVRQEERDRRSVSGRALASATGVKDMRQRMSKMFQSKNNDIQSGLPSLFRKKP